MRDILTSEGRTLAQGALAWLWTRSRQTLSIPGFKIIAQLEENCAALHRGRWLRNRCLRLMACWSVNRAARRQFLDSGNVTEI